jgi:hypothetical protein
MIKNLTKYLIVLLITMDYLPLVMLKGNELASTDDGRFDSLRMVKGVFDFPEITVTPSPATAQSVILTGIEKVIDYDV